jgi:hypothetical protein
MVVLRPAWYASFHPWGARAARVFGDRLGYFRLLPCVTGGFVAFPARVGCTEQSDGRVMVPEFGENCGVVFGEHRQPCRRVEPSISENNNDTVPDGKVLMHPLQPHLQHHTRHRSPRRSHAHWIDLGKWILATK